MCLEYVFPPLERVNKGFCVAALKDKRQPHIYAHPQTFV